MNGVWPSEIKHLAYSNTQYLTKTDTKDIHKTSQPPYWVVAEEDVQKYVEVTYKCAEGGYNKGVIQRQKVQAADRPQLTKSDHCGEVGKEGTSTETSSSVLERGTQVRSGLLDIAL